MAAVAALLAGCTTVHRVNVDAIRPPESNAEEAISYRIESGSPDLDESTLRFKNAAQLVKTALSAKGMYEAPDPAKADMVVDIDYGVSEPHVRTERRSRPIYRTVEIPAQEILVLVGKTATGAPIYQRVEIPPSRRQVYDGEEYYDVTTVTYEKHLDLQARSAQASGDRPSALWSVKSSSESEEHDLRKTLPILAAASMDLIGTDTRGEQTIRVKEDDGSVEFIRQMSSQ